MPLKPSFRHSETFQSLHKIAAEKGLIQYDPKPSMVKEAASKLTKPETFSEKILVLCDGLRDQGFHKYANEIENKFILLKKAELHLYNTTGEEGKDLVEFAHQEGGKKLDKDWDELGVVETIVERQNKILDVVRKQPTGKYASKNIINALRVVLADNSKTDDGSFLVGRKTQTAKKVLGQAKPILSDSDKTNLEGVAGLGGMGLLAWLFQRLRANPSVDKQIISSIQEALGRKLTTTEANAVTKQVLEKVGAKAINETLGKNVAQNIAKQVGANLEEAIAAGVEGGAAAGGGSTGALAAGGITLGVAAAAIVGSALIGGTAGWAISAKFYEDNLAEAGQNFLEELGKLGTDDLTGDSPAYIRSFKNSLNGVLAGLKSSQTWGIEPLTPERLEALQQLDQQLNAALKACNDIIGFAEKQYAPKNTGGYGHQEREGFEMLIHPIWSSIVVFGRNLSDLLVKANDDLSDLFNKMRQIARQHQEQLEQKTSGNLLIQNIAADKQQASDVITQISTMAEKPSVSGNDTRATYMQSLLTTVKNYMADLDMVAERLQANPSDLTGAVANTKRFNRVTSYDDFKAKAKDFHDAINQRLQTVAKW